MSSYVKRRNCCLLKKSKKYFESIRQNTNEMLDVINEFTIKGEFCEFKDGDLDRMNKMRCQIGSVIDGWAEHTCNKLAGEVKTYNYMKINGKTLSSAVVPGDEITIVTSTTATHVEQGKTYKVILVSSVGDNHIVKENKCNSDRMYDDQHWIGTLSTNLTGTAPDLNVNGGSDFTSSFYFVEKYDKCDFGIRFDVCLHMAGSKLQAEPVPMYSLSDVTSNPFAVGSSDEFYGEYESNPDILIEDISEFLQAIDKLESLMKNLSIDNNQRDPDTEFCCEGNPPPGGKPSC